VTSGKIKKYRVISYGDVAYPTSIDYTETVMSRMYILRESKFHDCSLSPVV
jgi:hypothetical protein